MKKTMMVMMLLLQVIQFSTASAQVEPGRPNTRPWRVGERVVVQYAFAQADAATLTDVAASREVSRAVARETARLQEIQNDLERKVARWERPASRTGSLNPLTNRAARQARLQMELLESAFKQNQMFMDQVQSIGAMSANRARLTNSQLDLLKRYNFVEEITLRNADDISRATMRLQTLRQSFSMVTAADSIPGRTLVGRGLNIVRTNKGLALGAVAAVALSAWGVYSDFQASRVNNEFHDVMIYDDQVVQ